MCCLRAPRIVYQGIQKQLGILSSKDTLRKNISLKCGIWRDYKAFDISLTIPEIVYKMPEDIFRGSVVYNRFPKIPGFPDLLEIMIKEGNTLACCGEDAGREKVEIEFQPHL